MDNIYTQKVIDANNVFDNHFLNVKNLYLYCFNVLPSVHFIAGVDGEKIFTGMNDTMKDLIVHIHQFRRYKRKQKRIPVQHNGIDIKEQLHRRAGQHLL